MDRGEADPAYTFRTRSPVWRDAFLVRVARALAHAPRGHALFVELRPGGDGPFVIPLCAEFGPAIAGAAAGLPGTLRRSPIGPGERAPPPRECAFLVGAPPGGEAPAERPASGGNVVRARAGAPDGPTDALGAVESGRPINGIATVQSHWFPDRAGGLRIWTRLAVPTTTIAPTRGTVLGSALALADRFGSAAGVDVRVVVRTVRPWQRAEWSRGGLRRLREEPSVGARPESAAAVMPAPALRPFPDATVLDRHTVVVGASGSGKTALLAGLAAGRIRAGGASIVFDLHGDLGPAVVAPLSGPERRRVAVVDAEQPRSRRTGVAILGGDPTEPGEHDAPDLVAALKRLSSDGTDVYWGFRLERVFDTFVRLAQEGGGSLVDVAELLTDERRREAARYSTRRPELARFLDELPAILRRSPEFLWPAAARLSKVLLDDRLADLLAPPSGGVPLGAWLASGGSVVYRLPFPVLGPEASSFAATLLATRTYLTLVRLGRERRSPPTTLFVVDEAHALSPRLLTEILSEGRKFGVGAVLATQYPDRLAPELRAAAEGAAGSHVVFRIPSASAPSAGGWVGLGATESASLLPALPVGRAVVALPGERPRLIETVPMARSLGGGWEECAASTAARFAGDPVADEPIPGGGWEETILLALFEREGRVDGTSGDELRSIVGTRRPELAEKDAFERRVGDLVRRAWVDRTEGRYRLTTAGARYLGVGGPTGAVSEGAEHRALVLVAMRIFARHGERLELVRQGRFDTRLPDALLRLFPPGGPDRSPSELGSLLEARRSTWAWRSFGGRDVHVEAEVSGAERPLRIRRGLAKAAARHAFALFVVADPRKARRVRAVLVAAGAFPRDARVWTLREARATLGEGDVHRP